MYRFQPLLDYTFQQYDDEPTDGGNGQGQNGQNGQNNGQGGAGTVANCTCNDILLYLKDIRDGIKQIKEFLGIQEPEPVVYDLYWENLAVPYDNPIQPFWENLAVPYDNPTQPTWDKIN